MGNECAGKQLFLYDGWMGRAAVSLVLRKDSPTPSAVANGNGNCT